MLHHSMTSSNFFLIQSPILVSLPPLTNNSHNPFQESLLSSQTPFSIIMWWFSSILFILFSSFLTLRFFRKTSALQILNQWWLSFETRLHVHQSFKVPLHNHHSQENQLHRKILTYLDSLPSVHDADFTNLFSGPTPSDILLHLDANQTVHDSFLGANLSWTNTSSALVLRIKKKDKRRVFRQYFQHILTTVEEIEQRKNKETRLYLNSGAGEISRWRSVPFTHPASFETVAMDVELKNKVKSDLDQFVKSKQYYHRLGRVWKRSYLLYGASGTGKSSFVAAMARFLSYDVYDIDASKVIDGADWKMLLMQTTPKSMVVVEDLDRLIAGKSKSTAGNGNISSVLNFMDGIVSCCGEERVMVFTMNGTKDEVDQAVLRPGRVDVHIHFPLCDFSTFKILAGSYLGLKEHKLFPQVEEVLQTGARLSPAEVGEIMISNRNSPSRALKTVITALQVQSNGGAGQRLSHSGSGRGSDDDSIPVICSESVHTVREFRKLYGLLRLGSRRKEKEKEDSVHAHSGPLEKFGSGKSGSG